MTRKLVNYQSYVILFILDVQNFSAIRFKHVVYAQWHDIVIVCIAWIVQTATDLCR